MRTSGALPAGGLIALLVALALSGQVQQTEALGIDPIVDYVFPIWPSLNCFNPARTDNSSVTPSQGFTNYLNAVQAKANQFITTGLFFTAQCTASYILHGTVECYIVFDHTSYGTGPDTLKNTERSASARCAAGQAFNEKCKASFILHGTVECYFVFDRTSYRTGLDVLKNTEPYPGVSLNFCALQLDGGPIKTSTICFDNSGIDPNHPYVIAKTETPGPQYNLFVVLFGASVHDANSMPPQDYTIAYTCAFV